MQNSIKGTVGSKPTSQSEVIGRAYVVEKSTDPTTELRHMPDNHILVIDRASPAHAPHIKRALAVVADVGGVSSHAVTISREMGIPCVVGTQSATKALQTGDQIHVDLNTGQVKKV